MRKNIELRRRARKLRARGYSLNEIRVAIGAAKSSVSGWIRGVVLNQRARRRLSTKIKLGQIIAAEKKRARTKQVLDSLSQQAIKDLRASRLSHIRQKFTCALIYWCEGAKDIFSPVRFTNSDPKLINLFLSLLRTAFQVEEGKFRVCLHLHEYHQEAQQIDFWSKLTKIAKEQFIKPYRKPHTGKRIRDDYPGCVAIHYYDNRLQKELIVRAQVFLNSFL